MKPTTPKSCLKSLFCRSSLFVACLGILTPFLPAAAQAATLAVPAQYATIQAGVNAAQNGDTVLVADGTYTGPGNVDIDFGGKNITVTSQHGAASTIIDCQGNGINSHRGFYLHSGETSAVISGLTIENGSENGNSDSTGGAILSVSVGVTIQNCIIKNNTATKGGGIANYCQDGTITVSQCTIINNTVPNYEGGGIYNEMGGSGLIQVEDCTVSANRSSNGAGGGIANYNLSLGTISVTNCTLTKNTTSYGGGLFDFYLYNGPILVINCSITRNTAQDGTGEYNSDSQNTTAASPIQLTNDIFYNDVPLGSGSTHEITSYPGSTASVTVSHCDIQGGYAGTGNINADPKFVSTTDFHLQPGSPCLGAGTASGAPATDITGATRPNPPSIGAYEAGPIASNSRPIVYTLWNSADGQVQVRTVNLDGSQTTLATFGPYTDASNAGVPGNTALWKAIAVARVPDGTLRLLWQHPDGRVMLWRLNASGAMLTVTGYGPYTDAGDTGVAGNTGLWHAVGLSVSADGLTHLLWDHPDGRAMLWSVNPDDTFTVIAGYGPYTDAGDAGVAGNTAVWHTTALANASDGSLRLLWNHPDGRVMLWNVSEAGALVSLGGYGPYTDAGDAGVPGNTALWNAVAVQVSADGDAHLLWDHPDGRVMVWDVDSSYNIAALTGYGPYTDAPAGNSLWHAIGLALTPTNLPYVLWGNPDGRSVLWNVGANGTINYSGIFESSSDSAGQLWQPTALSGN